MKRVLGLSLVAILFMAGFAYAHCGNCGVEGKAHGDMDTMVVEKTDKMAKELKLSDEQKTQVQAIVKEKMEKKHEIMEENQKAMKSVKEDFHTKLKDVLSEEQMKDWEAKKAQKENEMKHACPMCKDGKMCKMCKKQKAKDKKSHQK